MSYGFIDKIVVDEVQTSGEPGGRCPSPPSISIRILRWDVLVLSGLRGVS